MQKEKVVKTKAQSRAVLRMFYELMLVVGANGKRIGTHEIQNKLLVNFGIQASLRTIQRDLNELKSLDAPIKSDDCKPQGWSYQEKLKEVA